MSTCGQAHAEPPPRARPTRRVAPMPAHADERDTRAWRAGAVGAVLSPPTPSESRRSAKSAAERTDSPRHHPSLCPLTRVFQKKKKSFRTRLREKIKFLAFSLLAHAGAQGRGGARQRAIWWCVETNEQCACQFSELKSGAAALWAEPRIGTSGRGWWRVGLGCCERVRHEFWCYKRCSINPYHRPQVDMVDSASLRLRVRTQNQPTESQ